MGTNATAALLYLAVLLGIVVTCFLIDNLRSCLRSLKVAREADAGAAHRLAPPQSEDSGTRPAPAPRSDGRGDRALPAAPRQQPCALARVAVDLVRQMEPLVCTYRKSDGWAEATCAVCLSDLTDGVNVRVLPACMHCFHAACVGEWLLAHRTCPLCRAPLDTVVGAEIPEA